MALRVFAGEAPDGCGREIEPNAADTLGIQAEASSGDGAVRAVGELKKLAAGSERLENRADDCDLIACSEIANG